MYIFNIKAPHVYKEHGVIGNTYPKLLELLEVPKVGDATTKFEKIIVKAKKLPQIFILPYIEIYL